jgi:F-type H+-transporting ATPase subunit alpha
MLRQGQYSPNRVAYQVVQMYAGTQKIEGKGQTYVRDIPLDDIPRYVEELYAFAMAKYPKLFDEIEAKKDLTKELEADVKKLLIEFLDAFKPTAAKAN